MINSAHKEHKPTVFLTGATGLVGSYLLKILLKNGHKVYALSRNKNDKKSKNRVVDAIKFWDKRVYSKYGKNLVIVGGDITQKDLGIKKVELKKITKETEEIFHCAASIAFNWPLDKMRQVNVEGTRNVLSFASKCKNLIKVNHLSTAYVCGNYTGVFTEKNLNVGQQFNTTYEKSKFEAEKLVRKYRKNKMWIDIFRPALVIGESTTGRTINKAQGFYQTLHLWKSGIFDKFPAKGIAINIIPVDLLIKHIYQISTKSTILNSTYHIFLKNKVAVESLVKKASQIAHFKLPQIIYLEDFDYHALSPIKQLILRTNLFCYNPKVLLKSKISCSSKNLNEALTKILKYAFK
jgi:thioester reductase-like protein